MPVFVSTTFAPIGSRVGDAIGALVSRGIRRIELGSTHCHELEPATAVPAGPSYLVHNYFPPPAEPLVVNLASLDPTIRRRSIEHARTCLTFAAEIGAPLYTVHPGFLHDPVGPSSGADRAYDFHFGQPSAQTSLSEAFERMIASLRDLAPHAANLGVRLAVESEGSVTQADRILMQTADEFDQLFAATAEFDLGVNLNLGHLILGANSHGFNRDEFVDRIADRVAAIEISHNDGRTDDHRALQLGAWYLDIVRQNRFASTPIILECRDTALDDICASVELLEAAGHPQPR